MSQGSTKKQRLALQIVCSAIGAFLLAIPLVFAGDRTSIHPTSGESAKTLRFIKSIDTVGIGSNDIIKRILAGRETYKLVRPVAIDLRGETMIISDAGRTKLKRGMVIAQQGDAIASAQIDVEDVGLGVILKYDLKRDRMKMLIGAGDEVKGEVSDIYLAKDKSFYLTDVDGRRVLHFSPDGELLKEYKHPPNIFRPIAVTVDEVRNEVLVADETYSHIVSFDKEKAEPIYGMGERGHGPGAFRIITDMIAIPDGFLVSDRIELRVQVLDREGNYIANFGQGEIVFPTALAVDREGRVFVSDKSDSTIKVYKAGKLIDSVGKNGYGYGEFRYISDMKVQDNRLYVVDSLNARIQIFEFIPESKRVALAN